MNRKLSVVTELVPFVFFGSIFLTGAAFGQVNSWTNTANGSWKWEDSSKWSLGVPPSINQSRIFITNAVGTIPRTKNVVIDATTVAGFSSTMAISNLTVSAPSSLIRNNVILTNTGTASLHVLDVLLVQPNGGLIVSNSSVINNFLFDVESNVQFINANVTVSGLGAFLGIGDSGGAGTLTITGGKLDTTDGFVTVGSDGDAQMTISNGIWNGGLEVFVGGEGADGTLTMMDSTCTLDYSLEIGPGGPGTGAVWLNGGTLTTTNDLGTNFFAVIVGEEVTGQMTVSNGTWRTSGVEVGGDLPFPEDTTGTLTFAGGTNIIGSSGLYIGNQRAITGSVGYVWITGGQVISTNHTTVLGTRGYGTLIQSNGTVQLLGEDIGYSWEGNATIYGGTHIVGNGGIRIAVTPDAGGGLSLEGGQLIATNSYTEAGYQGFGGGYSQSGGTGQLYGVDVGFDSPDGEIYMDSGLLVIGSGGLTLGTSPNATGVVYLVGGELVVTNSIVSIGSQGAGIWTNYAATCEALHVIVGDGAGSHGSLDLENGTTVVYADLIVGSVPCTANGLVTINGGGELEVTNRTGTAVLEVRSGSVIQTGGTVDIDRLVVTNACGHFNHTGGILSAGTITLDPNQDTDGDGLPNGWEQQHGLDPLSSAGDNGANGDPDHDGFSNLEEYLAGTDPQDPSSTPLRITSVVQQGNSILVAWRTTQGKTNVLQFATGRADGSYSNNFTDLSPVIFTVGSSLVTTNYLDIGGATNQLARYYRVRLIP